MRNPMILAVFLALAGCAMPPGGAVAPGAGPVARPPAEGRVAAECRLLERAQAETSARLLRVWPDVLVGCPGHEGLRDAMTLAQMSAATRAANAAQLPPGVARGRAEMVYRRMITRGVPEAVARDMVASEEFAAAIR